MLIEKVRVYSLAQELGMDSKDLVALCCQIGIDVKSQLSSIAPEEVRAVIITVVRNQEPNIPAASTDTASVSETNSWVERLRSLGGTLNLTNLDRVSEQDSEDRVKAMRKAAEIAARRAARCPQKTSFFDAAKALEGKISEKSLCLLHHIRGMGNVAAHSDEACFTLEVVNYLTHALVVVLEEMIAKKLLA